MGKPHVLHQIGWVKSMVLYIDKEVCSCWLAASIMEQRKR